MGALTAATVIRFTSPILSEACQEVQRPFPLIARLRRVKQTSTATDISPESIMASWPSIINIYSHQQGKQQSSATMEEGGGDPES